MRLYNEHVALMHPFDCYVMKHHLVVHLIANTGFHGNPNKYSTWVDESLNKVLKAACKNASPLRFDQSVLLRMRDLLST
jgi:hypothetical protein